MGQKRGLFDQMGSNNTFSYLSSFFFFFIKKMCTITSSVTVRAINTEIYIFFKEFVIQNVIKTDFVISKASHAFNLCKCTHVQCVYFYMFVLYM